MVRLAPFVGWWFRSPLQRSDFEMTNTLGKRYICVDCGTEALCNKPGDGEIQCCDKKMGLKEAKPLPSSD